MCLPAPAAEIISTKIANFDGDIFFFYPICLMSNFVFLLPPTEKRKRPPYNTLKRMTIIQYVWKMPAEVFQDHTEYMAKNNNELQAGDTLAFGPNKIKLVKLKREKMYKRQKIIIQQAVKEAVREDGDDAITQKTMGMQLQTLAGEIEDEVVGGSASSGSGSRETSRDDEETTPKKIKGGASFAGMAKAKAKAKGKASRDDEDDEEIEEEAEMEDADIGCYSMSRNPSSSPETKPKPKAKDDDEDDDAPATPRGRTGAAKAKAKRQKHYALFLGSEWKNLKRNWKNYLTDVVDRIAEAEEEGEEDGEAVLESLKSLEKSAVAVRKFCVKWAATGGQGASLLQCFEEQVSWCRQPPAVDNPFSPYVMKLMHTLRCSEAVVQSFWNHLEATQLQSFLGESEVEPYQINMTAVKINVLTQDSCLCVCAR